MNILHLLSQNHLTGAEVYAATLIDNQVDAGHLVFQCSNGFFYKSKARKIQIDVETRGVFEFWKSVVRLRKIIRDNKIQIIHCHSRAAAKLCFYSRLGIKQSDHSLVAQVSTVHGRQHPSLSKKILNQYGEFTIAICENVQRQLVNEFKYNESRIKCLRNPVSQNEFQYNAIENNNSVLKIAVIGRCTGPKKLRTELFIDGFSECLRKKNVSFSITVIGDNSKNLNTKTNYVALDNQHLNSLVYKSFDLVCGSGRVCIEALISGVRTIAFGEISYLGLVTISHFHQFLESNFGDIGLSFNDPVFDKQKADKDIETLQELKSSDLLELSNLANQEFSSQKVFSDIQRLYESAYFIRHYNKWIPILMFHKIPETELTGPHKIFVTKTNFKKYLSIFKSLHLTALSFEDLRAFRKGERDWRYFPKKPMILTFDDGYKDNLLNASPELKEQAYRAQVFLLADPDLKSNSWDHDVNQKGDEIVSGLERQKWRGSAFQIGSHGVHHVHLDKLSQQEADSEMTESKQMLETEFMQKLIVFAYPFGTSNPALARAAQKAGYDYAVNTDLGGFLVEEDPYSIFRVNIFPNETFFSLWKKTSKWYRRYYFFKRKR